MLLELMEDNKAQIHRIREAHDRATSVYLPDRVIPMLPEIISNNLASLQPNKVRYALSAMMEFTEEGVRCSVELPLELNK